MTAPVIPAPAPASVPVSVPKNIPKNIYCQDWQVFMDDQPKGSVDLILTDPPYAISRETGFSSVKKGVPRFAVSMDFGEWDHQKIDLETFAHACYRALRTGGTAIIWYDVWKITDVETALRNAGFKMLRLIIWQKTNPVPLNQSATYLSNSREVAVVGVKGGKPTFHGRYDNGVYETPIPRHGGQKLHPTQKPIDLFAKLVLKHSNAGDLVIDPFVGSGTTGVAAVQNNRRFRGCDIDATYAKAADARVAAC
ncbi:MAG: DNA-methyltransferase [Candidatus Halichondribacter symbioticus]